MLAALNPLTALASSPFGLENWNLFLLKWSREAKYVNANNSRTRKFVVIMGSHGKWRRTTVRVCVQNDFVEKWNEAIALRAHIPLCQKRRRRRWRTNEKMNFYFYDCVAVDLPTRANVPYQLAGGDTRAHTIHTIDTYSVHLVCMRFCRWSEWERRRKKSNKCGRLHKHARSSHIT